MKIRFRLWVKITFTVTVIISAALLSVAFFESSFNKVNDTSYFPNNSDGCSSSSSAVAEDNIKEKILRISAGKTEGKIKELMSEEFLEFCEKKYGTEALKKLLDYFLKENFSEKAWYDITGETILVTEYIFKGFGNKNCSDYNPFIKEIKTSGSDIVIRMAGDTSLADNWKIMPQYDKRKKGVNGILSDEVIELLKTADISILNNEFTLSSRGIPLKNKMFTFRGRPERVKIFKDLGIDLVSIANNHAYDYGETAFLDTMDTLRNAQIGYVGGGTDLAEAQKPFFFIAGGRKIAVTAASRAEKHRRTPDAGINNSGVLAAYNVEDYIPVVKKAAQESDFNIVFMHWGNEGSQYFDKSIQSDAKKLVEAGADIIVGAHAHVLQGIEFISSKPVVYNLGNFIFNAETLDSALLEIKIDREGNTALKFIPCIQKNCYTQAVHGKESERILNIMRKLSVDVDFDINGAFKEKNSK